MDEQRRAALRTKIQAGPLRSSDDVDELLQLFAAELAEMPFRARVVLAAGLMGVDVGGYPTTGDWREGPAMVARLLELQGAAARARRLVKAYGLSNQLARLLLSPGWAKGTELDTETLREDITAAFTSACEPTLDKAELARLTFQPWPDLA